MTPKAAEAINPRALIEAATSLPWSVGFKDGSGPRYIVDVDEESVVSGASDDAVNNLPTLLDNDETVDVAR